MYEILKREPRNVIYMEILELLRRTKRKMYVLEIARRTKLTKKQVYHALENRLRRRSLVDITPREKLQPGKGKPPLGRMMISIKRDKKTGKIPKNVDLILNRYGIYKTRNKLW